MEGDILDTVGRDLREKRSPQQVNLAQSPTRAGNPKPLPLFFNQEGGGSGGGNPLIDAIHFKKGEELQQGGVATALFF
jgi:hypothetical protein